MYERWDDSLSLGFASLDAEHKRLFEINDRIKSAIDSQAESGTARHFVQQLLDYRGDDLHSMFHDSCTCSPELATWIQVHRGEHNYLADRARAFLSFRGGDERTQLSDLHFFLSRWLSDHVESNLRELEALFANSARQ